MLEDLIHELLIKRGWNVAPKMTVYNSAAAINGLDSGGRHTALWRTLPQ